MSNIEIQIAAWDNIIHQATAAKKKLQQQLRAVKGEVSTSSEVSRFVSEVMAKREKRIQKQLSEKPDRTSFYQPQNQQR